MYANRLGHFPYWAPRGSADASAFYLSDTPSLGECTVSVRYGGIAKTGVKQAASLLA